MKKLALLMLTMFFVVSLTGCGLLFDKELKKEITDIIEDSDVQLVTEDYHHLQEENIEYANGNTTKRVYSYPEAANKFLKDYIGCTVFENGQQVHNEEYIRDEKDNVISVIRDSVTTAYDLTYDDNDRVIKKVISVDGVARGYEEYTFDAQGEITETKVYEGDKLIKRVVTEYDSNDRRTKITHYDGSETVMSYAVCEFDEKKYKEKVTQYDASGALTGYQWNLYDLYGLVLVEEAYDTGDHLISTTTRRYFSGQITYDLTKGHPGKS